MSGKLPDGGIWPAGHRKRKVRFQGAPGDSVRAMEGLSGKGSLTWSRYQRPPIAARGAIPSLSAVRGPAYGDAESAVSSLQEELISHRPRNFASHSGQSTAPLARRHEQVWLVLTSAPVASIRSRLMLMSAARIADTGSFLRNVVLQSKS